MDSVRFVERRNVVSARMPSHFKRSVTNSRTVKNSDSNILIMKVPFTLCYVVHKLHQSDAVS